MEDHDGISTGGVPMRWFITGTIAAAILAAAAVAAQAQGICQSLWVERNSIYKEAGYCFKTARAINYFGNGGCRYDVEAALPLSQSQRAQIGRILAMERANGCR
jgi:YARHG domain-containing protein